METRRLVAAGGGVLVALGPPVAGGSIARAANTLQRLGYSDVSVTLCERIRQREWSCLVESSRTAGRFGWLHFHRSDDGTFVVTDRRAGQLVP
jgi:hypothetical protein